MKNPDVLPLQASSHSRPIRNQKVWHTNLVRNSRHLKHYHLQEKDEHKPVLQGFLATEQFQQGLSLHTVNAQIVQPFSFEAELEPSLKVSVVLAGNTRMNYGEHTLELGPGFGQRVPLANAQACAIALNEAERCSHQATRPDIRQSLTLTLSHQWLESQQVSPSAIRQLLGRHLATCNWRLPEPLGLMAGQILLYTSDDPASRLMREGFALALAGSLIEQLNQPDSKADCGIEETRRGRQLMEFLTSGEADLLSVTEIGNRLGMSAATLQRHARQTLGTSLNTYLRQRRLEKAYQALRYTGASITEAASLAGYTHTTNFTTAFKRHFGECPKAICLRRHRA